MGGWGQKKRQNKEKRKKKTAEWGKKIKLKSQGKKIKKGKKKGGKKGEKGLKNASFGVINSKNFRGGVFRPPLHNPPTNLFVENYIKNGGKCLKNASFWVINSKNFRGGGLPTHPAPLHNPPTNLFVENFIKNGGKGLKNASFWVINSPCPPQTYSSGKKNYLKRGGGRKMIKLHNIYPCKMGKRH